MSDTRMHAFLFYKDPLEGGPVETPRLFGASLQQILEDVGRTGGVLDCHFYSLLGLRADADFGVWISTDSLEAIQLVAAAFHRAGFPLAYSLWGYEKPSQYTGQSGITMKTDKPRKPYLVIYPFVKTHAWYQFSHEERREMMKEHVAIGKQFEGIDQLLVYSVGLNDDEFVVAYETDDIVYFSGLVTKLRESKARVYTERDTPIFTCRYCTVDGLLKQLRSAHAAEPVGSRA